MVSAKNRHALSVALGNIRDQQPLSKTRNSYSELVSGLDRYRMDHRSLPKVIDAEKWILSPLTSPRIETSIACGASTKVKQKRSGQGTRLTGTE